MKVLIADKFPEARIAEIRGLGLDVTYRPELGAGDLPGALGGISVLVVRSTRVTEAALAAADKLALVIRAGAGVNTIDCAAASARGIYVANCPGKNSVAVAELTFGLLLAIDRRIADNVADLRAGRWDKKKYSQADGVLGKRIGIVGLGSIGLAVLERARAFGMPALAWSRSLTVERAAALGVERCSSLGDLFERADVVSLHLALAPETRGLVGADLLSRMKPGAILLNTARAEIVDRAALVEAAKSGRIRVGLDVFHGEPEGGTGEFHDELLSLPNVYGTHHIGASTEQAQSAIADETVRILRSFLETGEVPNCVNVLERSPARYQLIVRHYDKVGVLANVLTSLRQAQVNVQEMQNTVFDGLRAACAKIRLDQRPSDDVLAEIAARKDEVIDLSLTTL